MSTDQPSGDEPLEEVESRAEGSTAENAAKPQAAEAEPESSESGSISEGRIKIGSQRAVYQPAAPKPIPVISAIPKKEKAESGSTKKYPPPNRRGQLTPDLEAEFADALSGASPCLAAVLHDR